MFKLFFKLFEGRESITSVVIPVNAEYFNAKNGSNSKKKLWIETESKEKNFGLKPNPKK